MEEELMNELSPKFILIKLLDDIIIQDINNHDSIESVKTFMNENFGENNYYVISKHGDWGHTILTIVNRKKIVNIKDDLCLVYLYDKEPEIYQKLSGIFDNDKLFKSPLIHLDDYLKRSNQIIKTLSLEKYKFQISWLKFDAIQSYVDPTPNKKYFDWLCKVTVNYGLLSEDYEKYNSLLTDFDNPQVKSLIKKSGYSLDINFYKNSNDLFKVVKECYYDKLEDVEAGDRKILYEKRKIFEDNNWLVLIPESHTEAITLGRGTNWCTSADSEDGNKNYKHYTNDETKNLLIFINKETNNKYQYSEYTKDFLDENDEKFFVPEIFNIDFLIYFETSFKNIPQEFKKILGNYDRNIYSDYYLLGLPLYDKNKLIKNNEHLDLFVNDSNKLVRIIVAKQGYGLEKLVYDIEEDVRIEVAKKGYGFEILVNDDDYEIRKIIAKKGYGLEILVNDDDYDVRVEVANKGYGLDILVNDEYRGVREAIANKGKCLDILINDTDYRIRLIVAGQGYGLDILIDDEHKEIRELVCMFGYGLDYLKNDKLLSIRDLADDIQLSIENGEMTPYINKYGFKCYK